MLCAICGGRSSPFGRATVLGVHDVAYFRCGTCGFVQTEEPYWLEEAYSEAISRIDVGLVQRNLNSANATRAIISTLFRRDGRFLDYGGGYGLFVRLMRDQGFDFYRDDPLCRNLFAQGFDREDGEAGFELVTAFEVFEHLTDPVAGAERMLGLSGSVLFTTALLPEPAPRPGEWWYYACEAGQHVSLFTAAALMRLAARLGVPVVSCNGLHLLTRSSRAARWFPRVTSDRAVRVLNAVRGSRTSLVAADFERLTGRPPL